MLRKHLALAAVVAALGPVAARAATIDQIGGPENPPPAGYKGDQFVDSRGCIFMRAGYDGQTTWVPRARRDRTVLCGYQPTVVVGAGAKAAAPAPRVAAAAMPVAPPPAPRVAPAPAPATGMPMETVASHMAISAPAVAAAPALNSITVKDGGHAFRAESRGRLVTLTARSPSASDRMLCDGLGTPGNRIYHLYNGKDAVACQNGPTSIYAVLPVPSAAPAPVMAVAAPPAPAPAPAPAPMVAVPVSAPVTTVARPVPAVGARSFVSPAPGEVFPVPPGYVAAWQDGRLNPMRAKGTAQGQAEMDSIWTDTVPRRLRNPQG
ncbi:hypothetical protein FGG78_33845 [Thioclava sp. BHET1]|nr:hypothetical protein FGG78_33845 [Thioclava sp. BHET1]